MGGLNVHADDESSVSQSQKKKWFKSPKVIFGVGVLIAIPVVGTTLATTNQITVSPGITFGQGAATAVACDASVTITPFANYTNNVWYLTRVEISNLDTTPEHCQDKNITLTATNAGTTIDLSRTTFIIPAPADGNVYTPTWTTGGDGYWDNSGTVTARGGSDQIVTVVVTYPGSGVPLSTNPLDGFTIQQN